MFTYKLAKFLRLAFFYIGCIALLGFIWFLCVAIFGDYSSYERAERALNFYIAFGSFVGGLWFFLGALATQYFAHQLGIDEEPESEDDEDDD